METIRELVTLGKQYFDHKRYEEAEEQLRRVIAENVPYADVFNMMGVIQHVKGSFTSAIDFFRRALEINPRYTEALMNLAVLYNDLGEYAEARALYRRLGRRGGKRGEAIEPVLRGKLSNLHADIGDIYRSVGLNELATEEYEKALRLNPSYFDIRTKLGQSLRESGELGRAVQQFRRVLRADGRYTPALVQLGVTLYTMGKSAEAKHSWRRVLEQDPKNEYAQMYLRLCEITEVPRPKRPAKKRAPAKRASTTKRTAAQRRKAATRNKTTAKKKRKTKKTRTAKGTRRTHAKGRS